MGQKKHPFEHVLTAVASAGTNDLETDEVDEGLLYCYQRVVVENETSDYTDLRIFTTGGGFNHLVAEQDSPQSATGYWLSDPLYLREGQKLLCRLTGCTASDVLKVYLRGWFQRGRELSDDA